MDYFNDSLGPSEAKRAHENVLLMGSVVENLASGYLNPTIHTLFRLHRQWKAANFESVTAQLDCLRQKTRG